MPDPPRYPDPGTPRWVKVSGIIALLLVVLIIALHLVDGGWGGHMHHMPS